MAVKAVIGAGVVGLATAREVAACGREVIVLEQFIPGIVSARSRIVVTRRIPEPALALLAATGDTWMSPHDRPPAVDVLHASVKGADAIVSLLHNRIAEPLLAAAGPGPRYRRQHRGLYDNIDVGACAARGVVVTNTPGVLIDAADLAFALILIATRRLGEGGTARARRHVLVVEHVLSCSARASRERRSASSAWDRSQRPSPAVPAPSAWRSSTRAAPRMRERGFPASTVAEILISNPARALVLELHGLGGAAR